MTRKDLLDLIATNCPHYDVHLDPLDFQMVSTFQLLNMLSEVYDHGLHLGLAEHFRKPVPIPPGEHPEP